MLSFIPSTVTLLPQVCLYLMVGGCVTALDFVVFNLLTRVPLCLSRIAANMLSTTTAMGLGFTLHFLVVFQPHEPALVMRALRYLATTAFSAYVVQSAVIFVASRMWLFPVRCSVSFFSFLKLTEIFSADCLERNSVKMFAVLAGLTWNFVMFRYFVYSD